MVFYFESTIGCGLRVAKDMDTAEKIVTKEIGTKNSIILLRKAKKTDIARVKAMGGYCPEPIRHTYCTAMQ